MSAQSTAADFQNVRLVVSEQINALKKQEELMGDLYKPEGWTQIKIDEIMEGRAEVTSLLNYEKQVGNEVINVISSYDLVQEKGEDEDEDEDVEDVNTEDQQNGYDPPVATLFLVGIAKEGQKLPLFFECVGDRHGFEILRINVGLTYSGFLSEDNGQTALLYHAYMWRKHQRDGKPQNDPFMVDQDVSQGGGSPEMSELDERVQKAFDELLPARGIDSDFISTLIDNLLAQGFFNKMKFLRSMDAWLKP